MLRKERRIGPILLGLVACSAFPTAHPAPNDWPQWRGPSGQGLADGSIPVQWGDPDIVWKAPIKGKGHSSPIIVGERIFLTTAIEGEVIAGARAPIHMRDAWADENPADRTQYLNPASLGSDRRHPLVVIALTRASGEPLWERIAYDGQMYDDRHRRGSYASATPVSDGMRVYAYFGSEGVFAYDLDGNLLWTADVGDLPNWGLGLGASPVLHGGLLILVCDRDSGETSFMIALDKYTGVEVWRTPRTVRTTWSTPLIADGSRGPELIVSGHQLIIGYDPSTGLERWRTSGTYANTIASPVAANGWAYFSGGYPRKFTVALRLGGRGDLDGRTDRKWVYEKGTAYVASNILYKGLLYLVSDKGILTCLDPGSGEVIYRGRVPVPGTFMASPVAWDGKILLTSIEGDVFVIRSGREHEVLAHNSIGEAVWASPAIVGNRLYLRGERHLFAIGREG